MHRKSAAIFLSLLLAALASPATAFAADEWLGTWTLNVAKSTFTPPDMAPKSQTISYEGVEGGLKTVIEEVDAQGKQVRTEYSAKYDNKDYPVTGRPSADTVSVQRLDDEYFQTTWKLKGEVMILDSTLVSKDRKTITATLSGKDLQNRKVHHVVIYERQ